MIKEYTAKLKISRVMQVFKSQALKEALRRSPASQQYLTRRDFAVVSTGFVTGDRKLGMESRLAKVAAGDTVKKQLALKCAECE